MRVHSIVHYLELSGHMSKVYRLLLMMCVACVTMIVSGCSDDDESPSNTTEELVMKDVSYGDDPLNTMDLRLPAMRTGKTRMIVFIHGGGWREGSKEQYDSFIGQFVAEGFATASINYRYASVEQGILYPDLLKDIDAALLYLKNESGNYVFNSSDIVLMGHSAGAHLALLYAYRNNERKQVTSVISMSAPTDLLQLIEEDVMPGLIYNLVGSDDPANYEDASPVAHVKAGVMPTYIFHGKNDVSVPYEQSEELYNKISQYSGFSRIKIIEGVGHDFSEETYPTIIREAINFSKE